MDQWREGVEDRDPDVPTLEANRVGHRVPIDPGADDGGVDQAHVDALQAGLPRHRALRLAHRLALDALDELAQLRLGDGQVGLHALLVDDGGEALDQLARDADHDLLRAEAGHLLGLLERDRAVVDHSRDVRHRP